MQVALVLALSGDGVRAVDHRAVIFFGGEPGGFAVDSRQLNARSQRLLAEQKIGPAMSTRTTYQIYGLRVGSELPLPAPSDSSPVEVDLVTHRGGAMARPNGSPPPVVTVDWRQQACGWMLRYETPEGRALEFRLNQQATSIDIYSTTPEAIDDIAAVLLGPVLASALHLRDVPVLHAAAVAVAGRAVLVAGSAGAGKSTLAAALVREGASLLSEDLAVLAPRDDRIIVQPGYPRLRLNPDAMPVVGRIASDLPRVFSVLASEEKRWLDATDLPGGFCASPTRVGAIYLLTPRCDKRTAPEFESIPIHQAGLALLPHLYGTRWLRIPPRKSLGWCAQIAGQTPVRIVRTPAGLERVIETADAILADAGRLVTTEKLVTHDANSS